MSVTVSEQNYHVSITGGNVTVATTGTQGVQGEQGEQGDPGSGIGSGSNVGDVLEWDGSIWQPVTKREADLVVSLPGTGEYKTYELRLDGDKKVVITYEGTAES